MTDDEWQVLHENFATQWLLDAIGDVDTLRSHLSEDRRDQPPVRRDKQNENFIIQIAAL
jgi:hypothetical protein